MCQAASLNLPGPEFGAPLSLGRSQLHLYSAASVSRLPTTGVSGRDRFVQLLELQPRLVVRGAGQMLGNGDELLGASSPPSKAVLTADEMNERVF